MADFHPERFGKMIENNDSPRYHGMLNAFDHWLERNSGRFKNRPILFAEREECRDFGFEDVTPELSFTLCARGEGSSEAWIHERTGTRSRRRHLRCSLGRDIYG